MKTKIILLIMILFLLPGKNIFSQFSRTQTSMDGNNISTWFQNTGTFNQDIRVNNIPGFMWPIGSGKFALFTTGLCIGAYYNGFLRLANASYNGEYAPGYVENGIALTDSRFKIYKISRGDNAGSNPDYANWPLMIPYGAPYIDVNNNNQYDPGVDSVGIRNAMQVIFLCMTDGFPERHTTSEGFSGGTQPLNSQIAWTAWCYNRIDLLDIQFIKWTVINKSSSPWDSAYFSLVCDPDLGDGNDDYIGCDTSNKLGFCYNADNNDTQYGANPPAVGIILHKLPKNLTSFTYFTNTGSGGIPCETDPSQPNQAYSFMKGFKKDASNFMNPLINPPTQTKFVYTGDPETNNGWTEFRGSVQNCGGNTGNIITINTPGDRRFVMSSGAGNYSVNPNDTATIIASQLIARGSSNLNSVTLLKNYANTAWSVYNSGFTVGIKMISSFVPSEYNLSQNYPNPFNPVTNLEFGISKLGFVSLKVYDLLGKEVAILVNERLIPGNYQVEFDGSNLTSGIYFYRLTVGEFTDTKRMMLLK